MKNKNEIKKLFTHLLGKTVHEKFHEQTKIKKIEEEPDPKDWPKEWIQIRYKNYPRLEQIILPKPNEDFSISFKEVLLKRTSKNNFSKLPLSVEKLSSLLYFSAGLKDSLRDSYKRFYPSAGARYPLEVYFMSVNSELTPGIYHYNLKSHCLELLLESSISSLDKIFNITWPKKAGIIIFLTGIFNRQTNKYGIRGYRHTLVEAGHLAQNFYLVAEGLNLKCNSIGGYVDNKINNLLDVDGEKETVIYVLGVGN